MERFVLHDHMADATQEFEAQNKLLNSYSLMPENSNGKENVQAEKVLLLFLPFDNWRT